jgi:hypothetical protein
VNRLREAQYSSLATSPQGEGNAGWQHHYTALTRSSPHHGPEIANGKSETGARQLAARMKASESR